MSVSTDGGTTTKAEALELSAEMLSVSAMTAALDAL